MMNELFRREALNFLENKKALIFDDKRVQRGVARDSLIKCGVRPQNIVLEKNFKNAKILIEKEKPEIIISEFQVHDNYGLDLANLQLQTIEDHSKKIFIIFTSNATQSSVADAAEEEVEAFVVSPASQETMINYIYKSVKKKINPSAYSSMISEAKRLMREENMADAVKTLGLAKIMNDRPMMAYYLSGEILRRQGHFKKAIIEFEEGLAFNSIHYRCLLGKFMTLRDLNLKKEAFLCLEKISSHFPLTPDLLKNAFILSITSYHFDKVQNYYELYLRQPRKTSELKATVSQALLTAGKILLRERKLPQRAFDYFKKGAIISGRKKPYLSQILETLIKEGFEHQVKDFVKLLHVDELSPILIKQFSFKAFSRIENNNHEEIIRQGKDIIFNDEADEEVYFITCNSLQVLKKQKLLESIVYKGVEDVPEIKNRLLSYLKAKKAS